MNIKDYYTLGSKLLSSTFQAHPISLKSGEGNIDDNLRLVLGEYSYIDFPVIFKQEYGKNLRDILDTGFARLYLISENMRLILEEHELTGWNTFPTVVKDKKGNEVKGYYGFTITGRCGSIDYEKSEIIKKSLVKGGPKSRYYKGLYVGLDEWDGSDFFLPKGTFHPIVTKKAMQLITKAKLTNIRFEKLSEIETMEIIVTSHAESILKNTKFF